MTAQAETTQAPAQEFGRARLRKEDERLITGQTNWTDNIRLPGMLHVAYLRSPFAHARINSVDVSAALAESMAADLENPRDQNQPLHTALSTREFQIFCKLAAGSSVGSIGEELSLSVKTVSTYRSRILEKMSFSSNADMTSYALRNGLIQ